MGFVALQWALFAEDRRHEPFVPESRNQRLCFAPVPKNFLVNCCVLSTRCCSAQRTRNFLMLEQRVGRIMMAASIFGGSLQPLIVHRLLLSSATQATRRPLRHRASPVESQHSPNILLLALQALYSVHVRLPLTSSSVMTSRSTRPLKNGRRAPAIKL